MVIQKKDINRLLGAPNEWISLLTLQARQCRALWYGFIFTSLYLLVTLFSLTHQDLFLETPLALPVIQLKVSLSGFLWFAPCILLCLHLFLLLSILALTSRACHVLKEVDRVGLIQIDKDRFRLHLTGFFLLSLLAPTRSDKREGIYHLYVVATVITLIIGPLLVLLLFVLQALPLHQHGMINFLRLAFVLDFIATAYVWINFFGLKDAKKIRIFYCISSILATYFVFSIASLPKEIEPTLDMISFKLAKQALVEGTVNEVTGQRNSLFSNTLVLSDKNLSGSGESPVSMRGRNLDGALFIRAKFSHVDFTGASLRQSNFSGATAEVAIFGCAKDGGEFLNHTCTNLEKANLEGVQFRHANFSGSNLSSADLNGANLSGADFSGSNISAAKFYFVEAEKADFSSTVGLGTQFESSEISGADFSRSTLVGANFNSAIASGVHFGGSDLTGSIFDLGEFIAVDFSGADLRASSFMGSNISLAFMYEANLSGVSDFSNIRATGVVASKTENNVKAFQTNIEIDELLEQFGQISQLEWTLNRPPENVVNLMEKKLAKADEENLKSILDNSLNYPKITELNAFASHSWQKRIAALIRAFCDPLGTARFSQFDFSLSLPADPLYKIGFVGPYRRFMSEKLLDEEQCKTANSFSEEQLSTLRIYASAEPEEFELALPKR